MEKEINIAELLKDCPKGMELYSTIYGTVYFEGVRDTGYATMIDVTTFCNTKESFYPDGKFNTHYSESEMTLFPSKDVRTWKGFKPPCKFKDGDIVSTGGGRYIYILKGEATEEENCYKGKIYFGYCTDTTNKTINSNVPWNFYRFATEEEKQKLFQVIKDNGYKWNAETKTLEKLIKPKFKVRDRIEFKYHERSPELVVEVKDNGYILSSGRTLMFQDENAWELYTGKFYITTLKPFDKVLVRGDVGQRWVIDFFGFMDNDKGLPFVCVGHYVIQCIPYEGNEHLPGKTDDCDDFYKTWG